MDRHYGKQSEEMSTSTVKRCTHSIKYCVQIKCIMSKTIITHLAFKLQPKEPINSQTLDDPPLRLLIVPLHVIQV
jgi:hypothetical protein